MSILGSVNAMKGMTDKVIAFEMFWGAAASVQSLSGAAITATHPDLRRIFKEYLQENLIEHETLATYVQDQQWMNPFDTPENQLQLALADADEVIPVRA